MSEQEYMDADFEVIGMCNKCHKDGPGPGGELPTFEIPSHITTPEVINIDPTPALSHEESTALDMRIQNLRNALPMILFGAFALFVFVTLTAM